VDFIAVAAGPDRIWLFRDASHQALIERDRGRLRYTPVANLMEDDAGELHFDKIPFGPGLPLELFEDPLLIAADRESWLADWHTESEWFEAVHRTLYSNGIIGLTEQLLYDCPLSDPYRERRRSLRRTDLLVFASDHWNFNVRGFNPGGNHGALFQISTHSVLMFAGGKSTGIPRGLHVSTPYDSLSLVPTILTLMGTPEPSLPGPVIKEVLGQQ
jgi:hypothetical protein